MVIILVTGFEVSGFKPSGVDGFFESVKILSMTYFGRKVKPWVHVVDLEEPQAEIRASEQNLSDFSGSM